MGRRKEIRDQADAVLPVTADPALPETPSEHLQAPDASAANEEMADATPSLESIKVEPIVTQSAPAELPMIDGPNLDGSEPIAAASTDSESTAPDAADIAAAEAVKAPSAPRGLSRLAMLAAMLAIVAATGSFVGSLGAAGVARLFPVPAAPAVASVNHGAPQSGPELAAMKASLDAATRSANTQFAKLADRIDRAERAQADPAAKIARIAEAVERLEKRGVVAAAAAPETTGSIPAPVTAATAADQKNPDRALEGWVVHQVSNGRALIESRFGDMFEISAGGFLPGVGRVEQIKRQDGHWLVVTARGVIHGYH